MKQQGGSLKWLVQKHSCGMVIHIGRDFHNVLENVKMVTQVCLGCEHLFIQCFILLVLKRHQVQSFGIKRPTAIKNKKTENTCPFTREETKYLVRQFCCPNSFTCKLKLSLLKYTYLLGGFEIPHFELLHKTFLLQF